MRVELIYTPGCNSYQKALNTLQTVIAEERLPIPVEMIESTCSREVSPTIKIDGDDINEMQIEAQGDYCRLYRTGAGMSATPCVEALRDLIWRRWKDLTEAPLLGL